MSQCGVELVLKLSAPDALSSHTGAGGVSCLDHETLNTAETPRLRASGVFPTGLTCETDLNDPMEYVAVVVTVPAVDAEVLHRFRASEEGKKKNPGL